MPYHTTIHTKNAVLPHNTIPYHTIPYPSVPQHTIPQLTQNSTTTPTFPRSQKHDYTTQHIASRHDKTQYVIANRSMHHKKNSYFFPLVLYRQCQMKVSPMSSKSVSASTYLKHGMQCLWQIDTKLSLPGLLEQLHQREKRGGGLCPEQPVSLGRLQRRVLQVSTTRKILIINNAVFSYNHPGHVN